jgi:magnesium transporter
VDFDNLGRFLFKASIVSLIIGIACGLIAGAVALLWQGDWILGVTVAVSMTVAIIASALLGVLVPYLFRAIKIDPAVAAGPTVTTVNDIVAIGIYYLVALSIVA